MEVETVKRDVAREIRALEDRRYQAMIAMDLDALGALLGDTLVYTHSSASVDDKTSYIEGIRAGKFVYKKAERSDERIDVYGDVVVCAGEANFDLVVRGTPKKLRSRYLNVWSKGASGWQMVAWQSTPIPA